VPTQSTASKCCRASLGVRANFRPAGPQPSPGERL
jgi:hypothetical protein